MRSVFWQSLRSYRTSLSVVSASLFGISLVLVATFDAFGGVEGFEGLLELLPESIRAMLKAQGGNLRAIAMVLDLAGSGTKTRPEPGSS